jgi:hypothetical protein
MADLPKEMTKCEIRPRAEGKVMVKSNRKYAGFSVGLRETFRQHPQVLFARVCAKPVFLEENGDFQRLPAQAMEKCDTWMRSFPRFLTNSVRGCLPHARDSHGRLVRCSIICACVQHISPRANRLLPGRELVAHAFLANGPCQKKPANYREWPATGCGPSFLNYAGTEEFDGPR